MTIFKMELKRGKLALVIWTGVIGFMLLICILMFPEMKGQMNEISDMFASMGIFTEAFGMDQLNFGDIMGFYGIECGNILGIGGGFFAAQLAIGVLANEEKGHTAEFLLTHPISRTRVIFEKLLSLFVQIIILNVVITLVAILGFLAVSEELDIFPFTLMHIAYLVMQLEIAGLCFGVSAFIKNGGLGIGIGLAAMLYFINIIANIAESAEGLKYITPFGYAEASDIISRSELDILKIVVGVIFMALGVGAAFYKYRKKDIM